MATVRARFLDHPIAVLQALVVVAVLQALVAVLPAVALAQPPGHTHPRFGSFTSTNWAGYDAVGGPFTEVAATWIQPSVAVSRSGNAYADFWVGLDGDGSATVEQIGTEGYSQNGSVAYDAWYEMYPALPVTIPMTVTPGDFLTGTVTATGHDTFTLSLVDHTTGKSFVTQQKLVGAALSSAEVIVEAPYAGGVLPLADFGAVSFTGCAFNGQPIAAFDWQQINMVSEAGVTEAATSALGSDGSSFSVTSDTTPPTTSVSGADSLWHNRSVTLTFRATDNAGGSGVGHTEYSLNGGTTWTKGTVVTITAPADHTSDGVHTVLYRSADKAGNLEQTRSRRVRIDTRRPTPLANWAASVVRGRTATLRYYVRDARPGSPTATVLLKIRTLTGRSVKTILLPRQAVDVALGYRFTCRLARGSYRFSVFATDAAKNTQTKVVSNRLLVR